MTQDRDLHHLAAAYALDALGPDERAAFEAHYPTCDICSREVADFRETAAVLAEGAHRDPPASLKASVMAEIARTPQVSPLPSAPTRIERTDRRRWQMAVAAVAAAIALVAGTVALTRPDHDDFDNVVTAADAEFTALVGESGAVLAVWSPERDQVALEADRLAHPGPGLAYALWLLAGSEATPAGLFAPEGDGSLRVVVDIEALDGLAPDAWGITIEPETGSEQPTTPVLFAGDV